MGGTMRTIKVASSLLLAMAFTACGSDDSSSPQSTASSAPQSTASSAPQSTASSAPATESWDAVVKAANAEGKVSIYTSTVLADADELQKAWNASYPDIDLEWVRL